MDRRTRICLWVIALGLANFAAYIIGYTYVGPGGGDAMNGMVIRDVADPDVRHYYVGRMGNLFEVGPGLWIYSAIHSCSIFPTMAAVMLAMLTLAKDRIVSSMRSTIIRGRTFITIVATIVTLISLMVTIWFLIYMVRHLAGAGGRGAP